MTAPQTCMHFNATLRQTDPFGFAHCPLCGLVSVPVLIQSWFDNLNRLRAEYETALSHKEKPRGKKKA